MPRRPRQPSTVLTLRRPIAVIDLETTGISPEADRIVEIGILKVFPDGETTRFRKRIKPGIKIPRDASQVHGITNHHVAGKPKFKAIARSILRFIGDCDIAGFNLKSFDLPMLQAEFARAGHDFPCEEQYVIDVKEIYHFHERRRLCDAVKFYCNKAHDQAHSALEDACATWLVLQAQVEKYRLPSSVGKLSDFMEERKRVNFLDSGHWFARQDGRTVFARGKKHRGESLSKVIREDPEFVNWILGLDDVPSDTKRIIEKTLPR